MSLGQDLASIRKDKKLSLEDIFEATKIPVHTLNSIENDTLLKSSSESKTYLRSFIRSYAKALKISDAHILAAIEDTEADIYDNTLVKLVHPEKASETYSVSKDKVEIETETKPEILNSEADSYQEEIESNDKSISPDEIENTSKKPTIESVNWADMSKKVYASKGTPKIGLIVAIFLVVIGLGAGGYFFGGNLLTMFSSDDSGEESSTQVDIQQNSDNSEPVIPATNDSLTTPQVQQPSEPIVPSSSVALQETLTVALYATYDKLEPVRVTSDFNGRTNPFWMDQGEAYNFDFRDSLTIRGQYSRMLMLFNGHVINNPRQNYFDEELNSVVITRDALDDPLYLTPAPSFPEGLNVLAPDSIVYRIRF